MMRNKAILVCLCLLIAAIGTQAQPGPLVIHGLTGKVKNFEEKTVGFTNDKGKDKQGFVSATFTMYFDKEGRLTSKTVVSANSTTTEIYDYRPDGVRKAVSETRRASAGPSEKSPPSAYASVFKYDKEKKCLSEDTFLAFRQTGPNYVIDDPGQRYQYCFDELGRLAKKLEMDEKGNSVMTTEYYYRTDGPPTQEVQTAGGRAFATFRITYEFDSNNNWIKRTKIADPEGQRDPVYKSITTRKIDYYK